MKNSDDQIREAALRVWDAHGLSHTTLKRIGEVVGLGEPTLLRRFGSKEELMRSAFALEAEKFGQNCAVSGELRQDLACLVEAFRNLMISRGRLLFDLVLQASHRDDASAMALIAVQALNRGVRVFAHYQAAGALRGDNPWEPMLALVGPLILPALQRDPQKRLFASSTGNVDEFLKGWARESRA